VEKPDLSLRSSTVRNQKPHINTINLMPRSCY